MSNEKDRLSATVDEALKERLDNKNINKSQLIESLLREYLAHGESTTVALKLRRQKLQQEKQNKKIQKQTIENEIDTLDTQINELSEKIKERREAGLDGVDELVEQVEQGEMNPDYIHAENPIIKNKASKSGVPPQKYAKEVRERL